MVAAFQEDPPSSASAVGNIIGKLLSLRFRDSFGREFAVTASHTCIRRFDKGPLHIVGIVEPGERTHILSDEMQDQLGVGLGLPLVGTNIDLQHPDCPVDLTVAAVSSTDVAPNLVRVSFSGLSLEIVTCSSSFAEYFGPCLPGLSLTERLSKRLNNTFYQQYEQILNAFVHDDGLSQTSMSGTWFLQRQQPTLGGSKGDIQADVIVNMWKDVDSMPDGGEELDIAATAKLQALVSELGVLHVSYLLTRG